MTLRPLAIVMAIMTLSIAPLSAQDEDVIPRARAAAADGRRADALTILRSHLENAAEDVDARLVYGTILSWDGRYDDARVELRKVLAQAPEYLDARVALMNVEWWSGHNREAREHAESILTKEPGNAQARMVRERVEAASRPWSLGVLYTVDTFSDDRSTWHETATSLTRQTPVGAVIARVSHAARFDRQGQQFEAEFYPRFRAGTYAFIGIGASEESSFYPSFRVSGDLYHAIARGVEVSLGYRRLDFDRATNIYVATASRYIGNWMLTAKVFHVPADGPLDSTTWHAAARRYFGADGTSFAGLTYGHGFAREEIRNAADLTMLDSDSIRGDVARVWRQRIRWSASLGASRQELQNDRRLWQTTFTGGMAVLF
jgi:YaiO family outer membrane protein